jgi:hypothetical protein
VFTLKSAQVTVSPILIHLPRIDNGETFLITQNSASDQTHAYHAYHTIPGLSVTVYAGTTLTMPDGTHPNPFPLTAVQVPVDRLPDVKPPVPTIAPFYVSFSPANGTASQPVAVSYPNILNTPPGTDMVLMTLDPTRGTMIPYGTGTVFQDGSQIVPDRDPAQADGRYVDRMAACQGAIDACFCSLGQTPVLVKIPNSGMRVDYQRTRAGRVSGYTHAISSRGKLLHISRRASAMSSSVRSKSRSASMPLGLRNGFRPSPANPETYRNTSSCLSGGKDRTFSIIASSTLILFLSHYAAPRQPGGNF